MSSFFKFTVVIVLLSILALIFFNFARDQLNPKIGQLTVTVSNQKAKVFLDEKFVGTTPFYSKQLPLGDHRIRIEPEKSSGKNYSWQTVTALTKATVSTIDLDLANNEEFTSGESLYFQPGDKTLSLLSRPSGAIVMIDKKEVGKTPLNLALDRGVHEVVLKKDGYLERTVPINLENGYKLSATVHLALNPFEKISKLDSSSKITLFLISNSKKDLSKDISSWVEGIAFFQNNFNPVQTKFDLLIDSSGKSYVLNQTEWENKKQSKSVSNVAYLAKISEKSLSPAAAGLWLKLKSEFN